MADDCTFTPFGQTPVAVGFHRWVGDLRPDLESMYNLADQDGTVGGRAYKVDDKPREISVIVWGVPDTTKGQGDGTHAKLLSNKNKRGTLLFYDNFEAPTVRLLKVRYIRPIGIGTSVGVPQFEEVETVWLIEGG